MTRSVSRKLGMADKASHTPLCVFAVTTCWRERRSVERSSALALISHITSSNTNASIRHRPVYAESSLYRTLRPSIHLRVVRVHYLGPPILALLAASTLD